jgi:hypothetical protein
MSGNDDFKTTVAKSYYAESAGNTVLKYCVDHTTPLHPIQKKLIE